MSFNKIRILNILLLILVISCNEVEKKPIDSNKIIIDAKIITYSELNTKLEYNSYCHQSNWRDGIEFKKENAFYVSAKINNKLLAELCESESFQINDMLNENKYSLYGKYINRWEFIDLNGGLICETDKFNGQKLIELNRNGEIDEVIIGPLIEKPNKIQIKILDSKYYPNNSNPEFEIK